MPQIIEHFVPERKGGQRSKYPWQEWFASIEHDTDRLQGRALRLTAGQDYDCQTEAMVNRIRKQAKLANLRLIIHRVEGGIVLMYNGTFKPDPERSDNASLHSACSTKGSNSGPQHSVETERGNPRKDVRQHPPTPQRRQQQDRKRR